MSKSMLVGICVEFLESLAIDSGFGPLTIDMCSKLYGNIEKLISTKQPVI